MFKSPSMANEAVTPPVVGSVSTETYGTFALSSRASAAEILASCIRLITPSIILAPPEADTIIDGAFDSPRDHLAHHRSHAAANEGILHYAGDHRAPE